jgi:uncharacterized protein
VCLAVRAATPQLLLGVNVLRNDARAALSIAHAVGGTFVRVNVHTGVMVTDQGLIEGDARATLLERNRLGAQLQLVADVRVKHAVPLGNPLLADLARDTAHRGLADVLVVTGTGTGRPTDPADWETVRSAVPSHPVWVGSGFVPDTAEAFPGLRGAIVGTWLHEDEQLDAPLSVDRVRRTRRALDQAANRDS